ncbi:uncharacterized protein I303_105743 [Kwoniella dejecticola CBS 10117]|uniref:Extracellular membrane protein CFEM domain-containing protein n=1 Tax=Kwoniella dejecticola CBS 10117 TaxID=1296121 RepID=A0A1A6A0C2_9TREE|nr:uncharacterized protein I303_05765 [Kwoniella dejecticola CBS 10117]OBR83486.1 hypothetical protein I303_05765 [Kwoniella dejecticola CBS 10117]
MSAKTLFFAAAAVIGAAVVKGQAAPNWQYIPSACQDQCSSTLQSAYTCETTYSTSTEVYGCFCNNYPTDVDACSSCLNSNDASALGSLLTSTQTACPTAQQQCFFECSFDTCASSDISCQCDATYLANIYNCASCNTANGNTGATQVSDFQSLQESCANQNFTGADQTFTTSGLPSIQTDGYTAPTLTASGGGAAATGDASDLAGGSATGSGSDATATDAAGTTAAVATASLSATKASGAASKAASATGSTSHSASGSKSATASAAASSGASSGALNLVAPAFGGVVGLVGAVVALF